MSEAVGRIGRTLHIGDRLTWLIILLGLAAVAAGVAVATRLGYLPNLLGGTALILLLMVSLKWPLVPLVLFAALIPIEEVVLIDGLGTVSRFGGILFAVAYAAPRLARLRPRAMPPAGWAFVAWAAVSVGWALDPSAAWAELLTLVQLFLIAFLIADFVVERPTIIRPVLWAYGLSAAGTALLGIASFVASGYGTDVRAAALQDQDPAHFAALLLPACVFGLWELLNGPRRFAGGAIAIITLAGIVVSGTRGAWVALAVTTLVMILPRLSAPRRVIALAAAVAGIVVIYQVPAVSDLISERLGTALDTGGAGRTDIWSVAATIFQSSPLLGVGYANFPVAYTPDVVRASDVLLYIHTGAAPHNVLIGTVVELGPVGLVLFLLFLVPLLVRQGWGPDAPVVQAALVSIATMALFLDVFGNRKQVWLILGMAAGLAYLVRRARAAAAAVPEAQESAPVAPDGPHPDAPHPVAGG